MTEDERIVLKGKYEELYKKAFYFEEKKKEYSALLDDPTVKRFLQLKSEISTVEARIYDINDLDGKLIDRAFSGIKVSDVCDIYFYEGTYMYANETDIAHPSHDIPVSIFDKRANYTRYINLENFFNEEHVNPRNRTEFEESHRIIISKTHASMYDVRREYLIMVMNEGVSEAQRIIYEKYECKH